MIFNESQNENCCGVESRPGQGTAFWFNVGLARAEHPQPRQSIEASGLRGLRLAIVEDNETNRDILLGYAQCWDMSAEAVSNGTRALEMLQAAAEVGRPFDLAVIDMKMPGMTGIELGCRIKANPGLAHTRMVLLMSTTSQWESAEAQRVGFAAYLSKPIRQANLCRCLVRALGEEAEAPAPPVATAPPTVAPALAARILLTEDNPVNQAVALAMLQQFGCAVEAVPNGREAVAAVLRNPFDLVLMDCMMPEMDGYAATGEIRRLQAEGKLPPIPVIAITANAIEGDRERCLAAGMDDYLAKPFKAESLLRMLERWLKTTPTARNESPRPNSSSPPEDENNEAIDPATLDMIRAMQPGGGDPLIRRVAMLYLGNAETLLSALAQGFASSDIEAIRASAHSLKSSSAQVGAHRLAELCKAVELDARNGEYDASGAAFAQIQSQFAAARAALRRYAE